MLERHREKMYIENMNRMQRIILMGAALLIMFMIVFPPTMVVMDDGTTYAGYRFLFSLTGVLMVAWGQLLVQIVAITLVAILLVFAIRER